MDGRIDVFVITGFLGSGKTTFLNGIIDQFPKELKLMILMNEFGEIGIDGTLIQHDDLDVLEISKGSIFCACVKTDFIKGLFEISQKIRPDVLIIESTGVANPTDLKKDLSLPVFSGCYELKEQFCIIDSANFLDQFGVFASVENQISSSTRFIINKIDLASRETIEEIKKLVGKYHPYPVFLETAFAAVDISELVSDSVKKPPGLFGEAGISGDQLDRYVEELLSDPEASLSPPDILMSATFLCNDASLQSLEELSKNLPAEVVRGKGFIKPGEKVFLYSYVMGGFTIEEKKFDKKISNENVLVFIFPPDVNEQLEKVMQDHGLVKLGQLAPGSQT